MNRVLGQVTQTPAMEEALTRFFGTPEWRDGGDGDQLLGLYCDQLSKYRDNVLPDLIEEYSAFCASSEEKFEEEFDPALAYRQGSVWKDLKRNALTRYKRLIDRKTFKVELFPAIV